MDQAVNPRAWLFVLALAGSAQAAPLADPTRPPAILLAPVSASAGAIAPAVGPRLQSVLIARHPGGRHVAVIDGQTLRLGDQFKGARVERISETEVVLAQGKQQQVLKLFPPSAPK